MKIALITLFVKDMKKALDFYGTLLKLPIARRQSIEDGKELIFLGKDGEVKLELIPSDTPISYSGFSIGFEVEDLSQVKELLSKNGYPVKREISPVPSTTLCFFEGPNGEEVELVEYK